ncbi:MAG: NAD-dependent protein deacetylase [Rhodothermales bacterium]
MKDRQTVVLTGAGCSTESGIPDYRGPQTRHKTRHPIQYREFISDPEARKRYWGRSVIGWTRVENAEPNAAHTALSKLEKAGKINGIITQNVDRLHHKAGSRQVVELHGTLSEVCCLSCNNIEQRSTFQERLSSLNPSWQGKPSEMAPDGDAEIDAEQTKNFRVPNCALCEGVLKPNVVFFGENVPQPRVDTAWRFLDEAEMLLVVGSSLAVYSGYRFVIKADKQSKPVAMINLGESRGDKHAKINLQGSAGVLMTELAALLID